MTRSLPLPDRPDPGPMVGVEKDLDKDFGRAKYCDDGATAAAPGVCPTESAAALEIWVVKCFGVESS